MIYRLVGYNDQGDEVDVAELSADLLERTTVVFACPLNDESILLEDAVRIRQAFADVGIQAIVSTSALQLYKIKSD